MRHEPASGGKRDIACDASSSSRIRGEYPEPRFIGVGVNQDRTPFGQWPTAPTASLLAAICVAAGALVGSSSAQTNSSSPQPAALDASPIGKVMSAEGAARIEHAAGGGDLDVPQTVVLRYSLFYTAGTPFRRCGGRL